MQGLSTHAKGLVITTAGVLILTPDSLLVRLIDTDSWTLIFWRGVMTAAALGVGVTVYYRSETVARIRAVGAAGIAAVLLYAVTGILFILALNNTSVANTLIIVSAAPLFAAALARVFLNEPVVLRTWIVILVAMAGIAVTVSGSFSEPSLLGDLAALGAAAGMAAALTVIRHARAVNMVPAMIVYGLVTAAVAFPFAAPFSLDRGDIAPLLVMGLLVVPIPFTLLTLGPRYLPAPEVSLIMLLETVLGPFWVWLVLGEDPGWRAIVGGVIVVGTLMLYSVLLLRSPLSANR